MSSFFSVWHVNEIFEPRRAYFDKYLSMERLDKTKYVLGIYNTKCYKHLMSSVLVAWLVNHINELELSVCNNFFHWKGPIGPNMSSKINNIMLQYHICIKFDNKRKML